MKKRKQTSESKRRKTQGQNPTEVRSEITRLFQNTNNVEEFIAALKTSGYSLARSTRKVIFLIDPKGGEHNLFKHINAPIEEIKNKLADIQISKLPLKKSREREVIIKCCVTPSEKEEIQARAHQAELSTSGYILSLALGKKKHQHKSSRRPTLEKVELVKIRFELRQIGGTLTEMAKIQNQSDFDNDAFTQMIELHRKALTLIMSALGKKVAA